MERQEIMATETTNEDREGTGRTTHEQPEATREQIREDQHRFGQAQDSYRQKAEHQADAVKLQVQMANETGRQAVSDYIRAVTRGYQAFIPQAAVDPRRVIDYAADFIVQSTELQRTILHELVGAAQINARAAASVNDR